MNLLAGLASRHSSVLVDNGAAIRDVVDHLVAIGRTRIAHISGPTNWHEARDRRMGWRQAMAQHGLDANADLCEEGDWSPESGAAAMNALLDRVSDLDAVVAANDRMALGAMHVLRGKGLRIPEDVAVTGSTTSRRPPGSHHPSHRSNNPSPRWGGRRSGDCWRSTRELPPPPRPSLFEPS